MYASFPAISTHRMAAAKATKFSPKLFWKLNLGWDLGSWVKLDVNPVCSITAAWRDFNIVETTWTLKFKQQSIGAKPNGTTDLWTHNPNLSHTHTKKRQKVTGLLKWTSFAKFKLQYQCKIKHGWEHWDEYSAQIRDQKRTLPLRSWTVPVRSACCSFRLDTFPVPAHPVTQSWHCDKACVQPMAWYRLFSIVHR